MSTLSLEWLKHILDRCIPWHESGLQVVGLDDLELADELIEFEEGAAFTFG